MSNPQKPKLLTISNFTLVGEKDKAQLAVDGFLVTMNDLKMAGFTLVKSGAKGGLEKCLKCSPYEKTRVWYEATVSCNGVTGPIWICSNCSRVYLHKRRGMALWAELEKTLKPESEKFTSINDAINVTKQFLPSKEDVETAYKTLSDNGKSIQIDELLDFIELKAKEDGLSFKSNWRMITEENMKIWSKAG